MTMPLWERGTGYGPLQSNNVKTGKDFLNFQNYHALVLLCLQDFNLFIINYYKY